MPPNQSRTLWAARAAMTGPPSAASPSRRLQQRLGNLLGGEQVADRNAEGASELADVDEGDVAPSLLDGGQVRRVKVGCVGELHLGEAGGGSKLSDPSAETALPLRRSIRLLPTHDGKAFSC